jgi:2'-5' RNA ligase
MMPRERFGVVLLVPEPAATEIDGLRRACGGDQAVRHVAPHVTLVPPVNLRADAVGPALAGLRAAAATRAVSGPLVLELGPPTLFHPASETLYLAVDGDGLRGPNAEPGLLALRDAVFQPPLSRPLDRPFVAHVTLAEGIGEARARAAAEAMADYSVTVTVDRIHVLREHHEPGGRRWRPVADMPFARPAVVGRGGIELELARSWLVDPEAGGITRSAAPAPAGAVARVVTARRRGRVVGVAHGWERDGEPGMVRIDVAEDHRDLGVERQLRLAFNAD